MTSELAEFSITKLAPKPGDVIVLKLNRRPLSFDEAARARETVMRLLPEGVKALVVDRDVDVSLLTAEEIQQRVVTDDRSRDRSVSLDSE